MPGHTTPDRIAIFLRKANLSPPAPIAELIPPPIHEIQQSTGEDYTEARSLLASERINKPGYKDPDEQKRYKFSSKRREQKKDQDGWVFTYHEIGRTFDNLLSRRPLARPGVAQAILSHAPGLSIGDLWCHFHDEKLQSRMESRWRRARLSIYPPTTWLDTVTELENISYILLMCQAGFEQDVLDRAFRVAQTKRLMGAMEILLSYGAVASACKDAIRERVKLGDTELVALLLSASRAMSVEDWRYCMEPGAENFSTTLLLCLEQRPEVVDGPLLLRMVESQTLSATIIVLAYADSDETFRGVRQSACQLASNVQNHETRYEFFAVLRESGCVQDDTVVREELYKDVKLRQFPLIRELTNAGVSLDIEPNNAVFWAIAHMDLEVMELLKGGTFSAAISPKLKFVPDSTSEADMLRLLAMLAPRGLIGEPLHSHLIRAARKQQVQLVEAFLSYGASVEFDEASAVRVAIECANFDILSSLLRKKCSPDILSTTIPAAMALNDRPVRLRAMESIMEKGVLNQELRIPLQNVVSEQGEVDFGLIQALLGHKAPVDEIDPGPDSSILVATRRANLPVLTLLCNAGPRRETLSKAIPIAYGAIALEYDIALDMLKLLLDHGASGDPVHQTLLDAVETCPSITLVQLLLQYGAEANYKNGACFVTALETGNFNLLSVLCETCPPTQSSTQNALPTAIDPRYYTLSGLEMLLGSSQAAAPALNLSWNSQSLKQNHHLRTIIPCFLRFGLDVDLHGGAVLRLAIDTEDLILLPEILAAHPTVNSLSNAFEAAARVQSRHVSVAAMELLLEKADSAEIGQSNWLTRQTELAVAGDFSGLELLLWHGALVDFDDGQAIQAAAIAGSLGVLDVLLHHCPSLPSLNRACIEVAASTLTGSQKECIYKRLLAASDGILDKNMSGLLADSVERFPEMIELPSFLITRGAEVWFATLNLALTKASWNLCMVLGNSVQSTEVLIKLFTHARKTKMDLNRKYWVYRWLLEKGMPTKDISEALLAYLADGALGDLSILKLLLHHGATVEYKKGKAFVHAFETNSVSAVKLLSQYIVGDESAAIAFNHARKALLEDTNSRLEVYRCLLQWSIDVSLIYDALVEHLKEKHSDPAVVHLLIAKGADPNVKKAQCFVLASKVEKESEFRVLSRHVRLEVAIYALLNHFEEEWQVVWWCNVCLEEQPHTAAINDDQLLFQCLRKFPNGTALLKLLLQHGLSASATINHKICPGWQAEKCSALIWSLTAKHNISNDTVLTLLSYGGDSALPLYSSPATGVSAAFCCLLHKARTPVLRELLKRNRQEVTSSRISGRSLAYLGAYPKLSDDGDKVPERLDLRLAALYWGNFDAFSLLDTDPVADDGTLHVAALLALPKFVQFLLKTHSPDFKEEEFNQRIPLVLACETEPRSWCKIANAEADFKTRRSQTIQILAPKTNPKWRYGNKTVLHFALDNGVDTTKALIDALGTVNDPLRHERYQIMGTDGQLYSPAQYVMEFTEGDDDLKGELLLLLHDGGLFDPPDDSESEADYSPPAPQPPQLFGPPPGYSNLPYYSSNPNLPTFPAPIGRGMSPLYTTRSLRR